MTIIGWREIRRSLLPLIALALAFPVSAGTEQDGSSPAAAARDWEHSVRDLLAGPKSGLAGTDRHGALLDRARADGTVPVIVRLKDPESGPAVSQAEFQSRRAAKRLDTLNALGLHTGRDRSGQPVKSFNQMAGFAMRADAIDVLDLLDNPDVLEVVEDVAYPPALLESVPLIGAVGGAFSGNTGAGQVVAILDTGVDKNHTFLTGKVVSEACYSTNNPTSGVVSLCPDNASSSTAAGSGANCDSATWGSACDHGTHVAGIAAGKGSSFSGVAKDATLIAIKVFSGFPASTCGGSPCVMAYTSDIIRGLEQVYALSTSYSIAAANLSLGGGGSTSPCDGDPTKPSIDKLRTAGIATVIASGNNSYINAISAPGCISSAISVGASCDFTGYSCSGVDAVASYSNSASFLTLLAPGSLITSSVPGYVPDSGYGNWNGTSMATPHVAGAWAVLKQARPTATVDEVLDALKTTGKPLTDSRNNVQTPRIQVAAAVAKLSGPISTPEAPTANAATNVSTSGFTANWSGVPGATGYRFDVSTSSSFGSLVSGYANLDVRTATSRAISGLSAGTTYYYRVRAYNASGTSANSATQSATTLPAAPTLGAATGLVATGFQVNWTAVTGATGYRLDVATDSKFSTLVAGYNNLDVGNVASWAVTGLKSNTSYYVRLRAYNASGTGASSKTLTVKTASGLPAAPTLGAATGIVATGFQVNWTAVTGATGYRLDVATNSKFSTLVAGFNNLDVGNVTSRTVTGLKSNTSYYVRLRANNEYGTSASSNTLTVKTAR